MALLKIPRFLEDEKNAPLLSLNHDDVLHKEIANIDTRNQKWKKILFGEKPPTPWKDVPALDTPRIIILDVERTFMTTERRNQLAKFLTDIYSHSHGDYNQALCYVSAFLLLTLDEPSTRDVMLHLHSDAKFVPGYWKREPVAAATDAYVFHSLVEKHFPAVAAHLNKQNMFPENYCQKWFGGLCTQILPFEALFPFFDLFFEHGHKFLFQFGLSLIDHLKDDLLSAKDFSTIFGLLRLDPKYVVVGVHGNEKLKKLNTQQVVQHALDFNVSDVDFATLRKVLYDKHLKERMERANKFFEEKAREDNEDDDIDLSEGEECGICHNMVPDLTCNECQLNICESCHEDESDPHKRKHKVVPYEIKDDEDDVDSELMNEFSKEFSTKTKIN